MPQTATVPELIAEANRHGHIISQILFDLADNLTAAQQENAQLRRRVSELEMELGKRGAAGTRVTDGA